VRLDADELTYRLRAMARKLPDEISDARKRTHKEGLDRAIMDRLATRLTERAKECRRLLASATT
jgi:serine/threonine-protein kinase HipA